MQAKRAEPFHFVMIKPSHYDDDGYPIQWLRSAIPVQHLGVPQRPWLRMRGAGRSSAPTSTSGFTPMTRPTGAFAPTRSSRMIRQEGGRALIGLVGVQSNQFPRAVDLARPFLAGRLPVAIGGFHVSGCISMLPEMPPEIEGGPGARHFLFRRRGRGAAPRRGAARCLERQAQAALQPHEGFAGARRRAAADPAAQARAPHRGVAVERRSRPRLSVPVLLLHHHQRAGPQEPVPHAGRSRSDRPRQLRAGHQTLLHHRRQFRAQPRLGEASSTG